MIYPGKKTREDLKLASFALENISEAVFLINQDAQLHYVNKQACKSLGYSREELLTKQVYDFAPSASPEKTHQIWQQVRQKKQIDFQGIHRHKDGHTFPVEIKASFIVYHDNEYVLALARDITETMGLSDKLQYEIERSRIFLDIAEAMIVSLDLQGRVTMANQYTCDFLGRTEDQLLGDSWFDIAIPKKDSDALRNLFQQIISGNTPNPSYHENTILDRNGKEHIIAWSNTVLMNQDGLITGILSSGMDITERMESEWDTHEQNQFLQVLLDSIPTAIYYKDLDFRYLGCNQSFTELIGMPREEIIGKTVFELTDDTNAAYHDKMDKLLLNNPGKQAYEYKLSRNKKNQKGFFHKASFTDRNGNVAGIIGVIIDITEQKNTEENLEKERSLLSSLIDTIPDMIFIKNNKQEYIGCNKSFERYSGLVESDLIGKIDLKLLPQEVSDFNREQENTVLNSEESILTEEWIPYKEGGGGLYETIKTPFYDDQGVIRGLIGISRDITERRKTETKLQHLSDLDALLVNISKNLFTAEGKQIGGILEGALENIGTACRLDRCSMYRLHENNNDITTEHSWVSSDHLEKCEQACDFSTQSLNSILRELQLGKTVTILDVSEIQEKYIADQPVLESSGIMTVLFIPVNESGSLTGFMTFEAIKFRRNWLDEEIQILQLLADLIAAYLVRESTTRELEKSRNELSEANLRLLQEQQLFVGGPAMVFRWSPIFGQPVQFCTENIQTILGYSVDQLLSGEILFSELLHTDDRKRIFEELEFNIENNIDTFEQEYKLRHLNGSYRDYYDFTRIIRDESGHALSLHGYLLDITNQKEAEIERRRIERELRQAQKMEALGQLSGSVAHEFNNMLSIILGHHDLLKYNLKDENNKITQYLAHIETSALRAKNLARQLLTFSHPEKADAQRVRIQPLIEEVITLSRATLPSSISIETRFDKKLPDIFIDPGEIQQILMNLFVNARDAMHNKGKLSVVITTADIKDIECQSCHAIIQGRWLEVSVADNGCGINQTQLERIFDPFFTTKPVGEGTGLGLSIIQSIMENNGGHILIESKSTQGTKFRLLFPVLVTEEGLQTVNKVNENQLPYPTLNGHILLIDDEVGLTEYLSEILQNCGLTVTSMNDSQQAKELYTSSPQSYDLIISDQTMPGLTGIELAEQIQVKQGNIPFILCSGYSSDEDRIKAKNMGINCILDKPVSTTLLLKVIQQNLIPLVSTG